MWEVRAPRPEAIGDDKWSLPHLEADRIEPLGHQRGPSDEEEKPRRYEVSVRIDIGEEPAGLRLSQSGDVHRVRCVPKQEVLPFGKKSRKPVRDIARR